MQQQFNLFDHFSEIGIKLKNMMFFFMVIFVNFFKLLGLKKVLSQVVTTLPI
jgi:hypothetical protein